VEMTVDEDEDDVGVCHAWDYSACSGCAQVRGAPLREGACVPGKRHRWGVAKNNFAKTSFFACNLFVNSVIIMSFV